MLPSNEHLTWLTAELEFSHIPYLEFTTIPNSMARFIQLEFVWSIERTRLNDWCYDLVVIWIELKFSKLVVYQHFIFCFNAEELVTFQVIRDLVWQAVLSADEHSIQICLDVLTLDADRPVSRISKWQTDGVVALFVDAFFKSVIV